VDDEGRKVKRDGEGERKRVRRRKKKRKNSTAHQFEQLEIG
jgi:hypothetical protein